MCGYKLPITGQNFAQKSFAQAKILLIAFFFLGGFFFDSPCVNKWIAIAPIIQKSH